METQSLEPTKLETTETPETLKLGTWGKVFHVTGWALYLIWWSLIMVTLLGLQSFEAGTVDGSTWFGTLWLAIEPIGIPILSLTCIFWVVKNL
jgi:hypothetical protein